MKVLLVGVGTMGQKHLNILLKKEIITSVTTVDLTLKAADYDSLDVALSDKKYDFSIVAVPTNKHKEVALKLISSGLHVLLEKPIAIDIDAARRIQEAAAATKKKVCVGHVERFNPAVQSLKSDLSDQKIISMDFYRVGPYPKRITDVGVCYDLSVHDLDLVEFLTNKKINSSTKQAREGHVQYLVGLGAQISATITNSWLFPLRKRVVRVLTEEYYYEANLIDRNVYKFGNVDNNTHSQRRLWCKNKDPLASQLNSFINYIENDEMGDLCECPTATRVLEWL